MLKKVKKVTIRENASYSCLRTAVHVQAHGCVLFGDWIFFWPTEAFGDFCPLIYLVETLFQTLMDTRLVFVLFLGQKV